MPDIKYAQTEAVDKGSLKVEVLTNRTRRPIEGAKSPFPILEIRIPRWRR